MAGWDDISEPADPWEAVSRPAAATKPRKRSGVREVTGGAANLNRGLAVADELAAGFGVATGLLTGRHRFGADKPGNLFANNAKMLADAYRTELAGVRAAEDDFAQRRPRAAAGLRGTGMAATAAVPAGQAVNLFAQSGRAVNAVRGATVAGLEGAGYAAADRGSARERLSAASQTARDPLTLTLGAAGGALATPRKVKQPRPVAPEVRLLNEEGVQLTPGQMRGGMAKTAEDAGTSLPMLGDAIGERRTEGLQSFNRAVVNRALKPVGESLPEDIGAGADAVKYAGDLLSRGYEDAMPARAVRADPGFADDVRAALANVDALTPDHQARLADILDQRVTSRLPPTGEMDGRLYKQIQSELDWEASRFSGAPDPDQRAIGEALQGVQTALENAARRQDPQFAARIDALDRGWAELGRIEAAAAKSQDLSGVFTPAQYGQAIRGADKRVRRRGVARGEAMSQDLARAGLKVLPSRVPDSGTAGRAAWGMIASAPGAVLGALTGGGPGAAAGIAGTAAALKGGSALYSPKAIEAANAALSARLAPEREAALRALADIAANDPNAQRLYREVAARLSRAAGVAGAAPQAEAPRNFFAQP